MKDSLWVIVFVLFLFWGLNSYFSIPDVYWSTSGNECVKVVYDGIESGCSDLPEKYNRVWVK